MQIAKRIALVAMGLTALAASASAPSAADNADEAALRAVDQTILRAYWNGDLETVVSLYAEDAVLLPVDAPAAKGRDAIRKYYAADMAALKPGEPEEVIVESTQEVSGNLGWSSGTTKYTAANGVTSTGKFLSVSRKVNGKWLYIRDTWNSDRPSTN